MKYLDDSKSEFETSLKLFKFSQSANYFLAQKIIAAKIKA
jgi:hypothetical protein